MVAGIPGQTTSVSCPVCRVSGVQQCPTTGDSQKIACPRCGAFEIAGSAAHMLGSHPTLRDEASQLISQMPRPAEGWLLITSYTLHELFPAELGPING